MDKETRLAALAELNNGADQAEVRKKYKLAHQTIPTWIRHGYIKPKGTVAALSTLIRVSGEEHSDRRTLIQRIETLEAQVAVLREQLAAPSESERRLLALERELGIEIPDASDE